MVSRLSAESVEEKRLTAYANSLYEPQKEEKMAKKPQIRAKTVRVRLYRASSQPPLRIGASAKAALGKMKKVLHPDDSALVRVDARFTDIVKKPVLDIFFDHELFKEDMVYLSNKMLFVMDQESALRLTGGTLECDDLGFYIDSVYFDDMINLDRRDIPKC